jgi:glutathione S-transferase
MKLFYSPGACSQAVHIALREAGLKFELERVDTKTQKTETGRDYATINPAGLVPALLLGDGQTITETAIILQYVADQAPASRLAPPPGSIARYQLMSLLNFIATEIHKNYFGFGIARDPGEVMTTLTRRYRQLDGMLGTKDYLLGDFSIADAYLFVTLNWAALVQLDLEQLPALKALHARIAARPAVLTAVKAEGPMQH